MGAPFSWHVALVAILLLLLSHGAVADDDPGFHGEERNALVALKDTLNSSFLDHNWTSIMCYMNNTPYWYGIQCSDGRVTAILLENMGLTGKIRADVLSNLTELSTLSFRNNSISGNAINFANNRKLTRIDLSSNNLDGPISPSLLNLISLESLQLQENNFNGTIPNFNQSSLTEFNVSYNSLSGLIPNSTVLQSFDISSFAGNKDLCGPPTDSPCSSKNDSSSDPNNSSPSESKKSIFSAVLLIVDVVGLIVIVFLFIIYIKKKRKFKKERRQQNKVQMDEKEGPRTVKEKGIEVAVEEEKGKLIFINKKLDFELGDLLKASAEVLGKGNFGNCYKAMMDDGFVIVVKRLRDLRPLSSDEFLKQISSIAGQKHPNLLPLLAFYNSRDEKLLVYKFSTNGNLYDRLHGGKGTRDRIPFKWSSRLHVARAVARALEYLHLNPKCEALVPHGNLKSSNVLLDDNETVLISDYGLDSLIAAPIAAQRMVAFRSPEYLSHKKLSKKSDVWSYGSLLLELLTGRIPSHSAPQGVNGADLSAWVHRAVREEWTAEIFDMEIAASKITSSVMLRLLQVAIRCCDKTPEKRPDMSEVVREVESVKEVADSEDEDSVDQSWTDESVSATPSLIGGDD